jgi:hypothetical protein
MAVCVRSREIRNRPRRSNPISAGLIATILILVSPAAAQPDNPARELAALFTQSCLPHAGDPSGLRAWALRLGLPELPDPARAAFLHGAPGMVFDATAPSGKFVVVSADDGICAAIAERADGGQVAAALEGGLSAIGVTFRLVIERDDKNQAVLHHREYLATKGKRGWRILAATVKGEDGGRAMLTAAPE